jgi:pectate lyase
MSCRNLILYLSLLYPGGMAAQQPAFPGAEGFGRFSRGGRGGIVVEVTNLQDAGPGSLRQALTGYAGQKRTIIFRVSGTIELQSDIRVSGDASITIAGQTAPGAGICLKDYPLTIDNSHDIIIRYLRFRPGDEQDCISPGCDDIDAMSIRSSYNVMVDHCSFSWAIDADLDLTHETGKSTVQYCILSEALLNSKHSKEAHSMAAGWDGQGGGTYHHNLIASCNSRTPRLDAYLGQISGERDRIDVVNNVIYNWAGNGAYGGEFADANWRHNYYRYGPSTGGSTGGKRDQIFQVDGSCKLYLEGNLTEGYPAVSADNSKGIYILGRKATSSELDTILVTNPFEVENTLVESAEECFNTVLAHAGASLPVRDPVDIRIVNDVNLRNGAIIDSPADVGGWPVLASTEAPPDTDHDGMPDDWELVAGLDMNDPADRNGDRNSDGYTNLEEYLDGLAVIPTFIYRPAGLQGNRTGDLTLELIWQDASDNETGFILERFATDAWEPVASPGANDTVCADTLPQYGLYQYRVKAVNDQDTSLYTYSDRINMSDPTGMDLQDAQLSGETELRCYPNPFTDHIRIEYSLPVPGTLRLTIYDIMGRLVRELSQGDRQQGLNKVGGENRQESLNWQEGRNRLEWDGGDEKGTPLPAGAYFIRLETWNATITRLVLKR